MENVKEIVEKTIKMTVFELKKQHLLKDGRTPVFQKVEKCLYCYSDFKNQNDGHELTESFIEEIQEALDRLKDDFYFNIIEYKYFEKLTQEEIAEKLNCDVSTVTRNKNRLIRRLGFILFSDQAIEELFFD